MDDPRFAPGALYATPGVIDLIVAAAGDPALSHPAGELAGCVARHAADDWGRARRR